MEITRRSSARTYGESNAPSQSRSSLWMTSIRTPSTLGATSEALRAGLVAALGIGDLGADVAGGVVAVGGHGDEQVGPHLLGGELVLDEQLARQVQHPGLAEPQAGDVDRVAGLAPAQPDQLAGRLGPLARPASTSRSRRPGVGSRRGAGRPAARPGSTSQPRSAAVIGVFAVASQALAMPGGDAVGQDLAVLVASRRSTCPRRCCRRPRRSGCAAPRWPSAAGRGPCPGKSGLARPVR